MAARPPRFNDLEQGERLLAIVVAYAGQCSRYVAAGVAGAVAAAVMHEKAPASRDAGLGAIERQLHTQDELREALGEQEMSLAQAIQLLRRVNAEGNVAKHAAAQPGLDAAAAVGGPLKGPGRSQDHGRLPEATLEAVQGTPEAHRHPGCGGPWRCWVPWQGGKRAAG